MAAEEKKPKIDLKARLGKASAGAGVPVPVMPATSGSVRPASSVAPPPNMGSAAPPIAMGSVAPPLGAGGGFSGSMGAPSGQVGVPMPPFGGAKPTTDPFGSQVAARSIVPQQATFKIELDEETMRAAQRGGKRAG